MKSNLLVLVSAVALGTASVLSFEAGVTLFVLIGIAAIAATDYSRPYRLLAVRDRAATPTPERYAARRSHDLRLAA
jgi:hypothetical protein